MKARSIDFFHVDGLQDFHDFVGHVVNLLLVDGRLDQAEIDVTAVSAEAIVGGAVDVNLGVFVVVVLVESLHQAIDEVFSAGEWVSG